MQLYANLRKAINGGFRNSIHLNVPRLRRTDSSISADAAGFLTR